MTRIHAIILTLLCCLAALPMRAQQTRVLTPDRFSDYGLVYALPATALEIDLEATHVIRQAGPFSQYARKYLATEDAVTADSESWSLSDVRARTYGVANDSLLYRMQIKAPAQISLCVAYDGMLLAVNKDVPPAPRAEPITNPAPIFMTPATEYLQYVGPDFIAATTPALRAEILARTLADTREARQALARGTADNMPVDGRQLELMLQELGRAEEALTAAFIGRSAQETRRTRLTYIPPATPSGDPVVLCRLSNIGGFTGADDLTGTPVYIAVRPTRRGEIPLTEKGETARLPKDGVMYCLPGAAEVSVTWRGETLFRGEFEMAQLGLPFALDPAIFINKKAPAFAVFDPATGALRQLGEADRQQ